MEAGAAEADPLDHDIELLNQLGFTDNEQNAHALLEAGGDFRVAVQSLIALGATAAPEPEQATSIFSAASYAYGAVSGVASYAYGTVATGASAVSSGEEGDPAEPAGSALAHGTDAQQLRLNQAGTMSNSSTCSHCKTARFFMPFNPNAPWLGLGNPTEWGATRRHHCRACWRSVCAACSPNRLPIKVSNVPERVCNRCWETLRSESLSVVDSQALKKAQREREDEMVVLRGERDNLRSQNMMAAASVKDAEEAKNQLKTREHQFEQQQVQSANELQSLQAKSTEMIDMLEEEKRKANEVRFAMTELNEQYEKEKEKEGLSTAELQQFQQEREVKEEQLRTKEEQLAELRQEFEEFESDMFTPTFVQCNYLKAAQASTAEALKSLDSAHFGRERGVCKGLEPALQYKGFGELDMQKMIELWGMEVGDDDLISPYKLQELLLEGPAEPWFRVDANVNPPRYVVLESSSTVQEIRERYPENADEILEHIRQAHSDYVGCSSAGTIVRVPWHVAGNREMTQAEIINAFERHLDKVNKRIEIMLAGQG